MSKRALHACVATALVVATRASGAESIGVLAVAPAPGPGAELVEVTQRLEQRIAERSAGALDARQLRDRMTGSVPGATLPELERASEAARLAYLHGEYERSVGMLRDVIDQLERLPAGSEVFAQWTKAMMRLARTELDLGRPESARATIERVVRAEPSVVVSSSVHPARLVEEVERARAALNAAPKGTLVVTSSAPGARVYVNGRDVGTTPVRLALARGRHRVSGASGSSRAGPVVAEVAEAVSEIHLDFEIPGLLRPALGPGLALPPGDRARHIVAAGGHLGLDRVVAVAIAEESGIPYVAAALFDVRRGALEREGRVRLTGHMLPEGGDAALAEFLVTGRASSPLVEIPGARGGPTAVPRSPPPDTPTQVLPATGPRVRGSVGLRVGYSTGMGNVGGSTGMDEWIDSQVPLQADVLMRITPRLSLGAYAAYGFGRGGGDVSAICSRSGVTCSLAVARIGLQGEYDFGPGTMRPWLGAGLGWEWSSFRSESDSATQNVGYRGVELLNLQGGADWNVAPGLSIGPFLMTSLGWYQRGALGGGDAESIHLWLQLGLRSTLDY